jgi:hypothetical protein
VQRVDLVSLPGSGLTACLDQVAFRLLAHLYLAPLVVLRDHCYSRDFEIWGLVLSEEVRRRDDAHRAHINLVFNVLPDQLGVLQYESTDVRA